MKTPLSAFAIVGLLAIVALLYQHSEILSGERDSAIKARDTALANFNAAHTHERELQAALFANEVAMRKLEADKKAALDGVNNAKPNDCTDAPVAPDIDAVLRQQSASADSRYLSRTGIETGAARHTEMGRQEQPRLGPLLCRSANNSTDMRSRQGRS